MVAHCNNQICTSAITNTIASTGDVGLWSSLNIGSDGFPIISYYDTQPNMDLVIAHCNDVICSSSTHYPIDTDGDVGSYSSITIGSDGLPIISYHDLTNKNLKVAHCSNLSCTSVSIVSVDTSAQVGTYTSITIGTDGFPIISYQDIFHQGIKVTHCSNPFCIKYWQRR
jgi:hypothetical protein